MVLSYKVTSGKVCLHSFVQPSLKLELESSLVDKIILLFVPTSSLYCDGCGFVCLPSLYILPCLCSFRTPSLRLFSISTAPQDAHKRLVLHVYLGSNTLEFSAL